MTARRRAARTLSTGELAANGQQENYVAALEAPALTGFHQGVMRASDHQFIQPLYVSGMQRIGDPGVRFDNEGSGYGFRTLRYVEPKATEQPTTCRMERP